MIELIPFSLSLLTDCVQAMILVNEANISNSPTKGMFIAYSNPNSLILSVPILICQVN